MRLLIPILLAGAALAGTVPAGAARADDLRDAALEQFRALPSTVPAIKDNPVTPAKIELGKSLFFDPRLSASGVFSCYSCHNLTTGGDDNMETSVGHGWQKGPRNAPTALNAVLNEAQFWDGRADDLKAQAKGPIQAGVEMNSTPENVVKTLNSMPEYVALFKKAFPGDKDPVSFDNMARAIEVFEATLITPDARFDKFLKGDATALSDVEKEGLKLFMANECVSCHGGVNMGGDDYYPLGVVSKPREEIIAGDKGRFAITAAKDDEFAFKSPSLRNIELTPPYFHSGVVWSLEESIEVMNDSQVGADLAEGDIGKIAAFLRTTTGKQPQVVHPILPAPTATTPLPSLK